MILQRYIGFSLLKGWLLVLLVLGAIFGLINFTRELDQTQSDYSALAAAYYTLMVLPNQLVNLAPVIALLGSIVALANLDRSNELTIISCTGFSQRKLISAILLPTLCLMAVLWVCMEYITPQMQQAAQNERHSLRYGKTTRLPGGGVWSTDGKRYIYLGSIDKDNTPGDIKLFTFNENRELVQSLRARTARVNADRSWVLERVREKKLVRGELISRGHKELLVPNLWSANELPTLSQQGDSMNLSVLYRYAQYLAQNGQAVEKHLNPFWQRLLMPLTVCAMVLLATPISASATAGRDRSFGLNLGIGAVLGIGFYLGAQIIFALGQLLQLSIVLVALLPALITFGCAAYLLHRMRW